MSVLSLIIVPVYKLLSKSLVVLPLDKETNLPKAGVAPCIVATALAVNPFPVIAGITAKLKALVAVAAVIVGLLPLAANLFTTPFTTIDGWVALLVLVALLPLPL